MNTFVPFQHWLTSYAINTWNISICHPPPLGKCNFLMQPPLMRCNRCKTNVSNITCVRFLRHTLRQNGRHKKYSAFFFNVDDRDNTIKQQRLDKDKDVMILRVNVASSVWNSNLFVTSQTTLAVLLNKIRPLMFENSMLVLCRFRVAVSIRVQWKVGQSKAFLCG